MTTRIAILLTATLTLIVHTPACGQDQEHPIAALVKASIKDPTKPFTMVVILKVKDGSGPKLEAEFAKAAKETRKEKGNRTYEMCRSAKTPTEYLVYERWHNLAALEAHLKTQYINALLSEVGGLLEGQPEVKVFIPTGD